MLPLRFADGARAGAVLTVVTLAAVASAPDAALAQSAAPAVAVVSTPSGALPSVGLGAIGSNRLTVGIRYGRLTDKYSIAADEVSEEGSESYERDVYAAELSVGLFGGSLRLQGGRSHARYIYRRADTTDIASPHGVLAGLGYARQLLSLGAGSMRLGVGSDLGGGWADLSGVTALSAHGQLPISLRYSGESFGLSTWAAPGMAWGSLANETGSLSTAAAGVRLELPNGSALDVAGTQLLGEHEAVWGGNRARLSVGISHSFGGGSPRNDPPGYRPRYGTASDADAHADSRRPRPRTMPRDLDTAANDTTTELVQRHPAAIPQRQTRPAAPTAAAPAQQAQAPAAQAVADAERTIFHAEQAPASPPTPAVAAAAPAPGATARATPAAPARAAAAAAPAARNNTPAPSARFTVQAAAKKTNAEAVALRDSLIAAGFPARIFSGPDYFRVRVGRFTTRGVAEAAAQRMRAAEFEAWVTTAEP